MTSKPLSPMQAETLRLLESHKGETVFVLCGEPVRSMNQEAVRKAVCRSTHAALRGLEARGLIRAEYYWRGANVTVL